MLNHPLPHRQRSRRANTTQPTATELADALDQGHIVAAFQPKITLSDRHVVGFEALARWHLAEQNGLIVSLTRRILEDALAACQRWRRHFSTCNVAVNISPMVLANPALPEEIEALLLEHGLAPGALIAEITEATVIANPLLAAEVLTRLRIKGIGLSMDDFGTGYSSLLTLLRLPFPN